MNFEFNFFVKILKQSLVICLHISIWWLPWWWSWSYGSWVYIYLCNQCLSPLKLWVWIPFMMRCTWYNIMWWSLSVTCDRSVVFSGYSWFLHQQNWLPWYSWNFVESGVKQHKPNPNLCHKACYCLYKDKILKIIPIYCQSSYF